MALKGKNFLSYLLGISAYVAQIKADRRSISEGVERCDETGETNKRLFFGLSLGEDKKHTQFSGRKKSFLFVICVGLKEEGKN